MKAIINSSNTVSIPDRDTKVNVIPPSTVTGGALAKALSLISSENLKEVEETRKKLLDEIHSRDAHQ